MSAMRRAACHSTAASLRLQRRWQLAASRRPSTLRRLASSSSTPHASNLVPYIVEQSEGGGERMYDIYSRLLKERIVFVQGQIHDGMSAAICAQLLFLESQSKSKPVQMYINSPGGVITAGMAIYDTMQYIASPVHTLVMGQACSMGSLLLAAGAAGQRRALPHARVMVHQPSGGSHGQATDIVIQAQEISRMKTMLTGVYAEHCGQDAAAVEAALDRDNFMTPAEALEFGIVDTIVAHRS